MYTALKSSECEEILNRTINAISANPLYSLSDKASKCSSIIHSAQPEALSVIHQIHRIISTSSTIPADINKLTTSSTETITGLARSLLIHSSFPIIKHFTEVISEPTNAVNIYSVSIEERRGLFYSAASIIHYLLSSQYSSASTYEFIHSLHVPKSECAVEGMDWTGMKDCGSLIYCSVEFFNFILYLNEHYQAVVQGDNLRNCQLVQLIYSACNNQACKEQWLSLAGNLDVDTAGFLFLRLVKRFSQLCAKAYVRYICQKYQKTIKTSASLRQSLS